MEISSGKLRRMQEKVVLIYDDTLLDSIGHGALINPNGLILTAYHLFRPPDSSSDSSSDSSRYIIGSKVSVKWNGAMILGEIIGLDKKLDLAILHINATGCKYAKFAKEVRVGQDVHMIVSDDGDHFSYTGGTVAFERRQWKNINDIGKITYIDPETIFVQAHNLHGQPGCSGAPIFDMRGRIVGVFSSAYLRMDLLVHMEHLKKFSQPFIQVCHAPDL